ncbi:unnamed protein product [Amoebophrya sp. A25]|nr:unnamed protein product [Amoebophrya sp. A25]|eukprot:GSA25T00001308001.1
MYSSFAAGGIHHSPTRPRRIMPFGKDWTKMGPAQHQNKAHHVVRGVQRGQQENHNPNSTASNKPKSIAVRKDNGKHQQHGQHAGGGASSSSSTSPSCSCNAANAKSAGTRTPSSGKNAGAPKQVIGSFFLPKATKKPVVVIHPRTGREIKLGSKNTLNVAEIVAGAEEVQQPPKTSTTVNATSMFTKPVQQKTGQLVFPVGDSRIPQCREDMHSDEHSPATTAHPTSPPEDCHSPHQTP